MTTCKMCQERLDNSPKNEHGFPLVDKKYLVGNVAKDFMGHAMYFTRTGRIALCLADSIVVCKCGGSNILSFYNNKCMNCKAPLKEHDRGY